MPSTNYIEFKRKRELGEILADSFKFLRQNAKIIFRIIAKTAGIPFGLFLISQIYYTTLTFSSDIFNANNPFGLFETSSILITAVLMYLFLFLYFSFLFTGVMCIVKSYIANKGVINEGDVIENIRAKIGGTLVSGIIKFFILILGYAFCFIPGVYFSVPMYLIFSVLIFENKNVSDSFSETFKLIKEEWWITFATMLVIGLIWYVASFVVSLPALIYVWIKAFTSLQESSYSEPSEVLDTVSIVITVVSTSIQYILYVIIPIGAAFVYYNLSERKHQTGTMERINAIGNSDDTNDNNNGRF